MDIAFKVQGGKIVRQIARPDPAVVAALGKMPTSILSDCLDRLNVLQGLSALLPGRAFAGSAVTVEEIEAGNLMSHLALQHVRPGDVLVIDGKGITSRACWGGLQTFAASRKGVAAIIVDGAVRDAADVPKYNVPVWCRGVSPAGPHKGWAGRVNLPISCAGCVVNPGDVIVGDADGLVVVPRDLAAATLERAKAKQQTEAAWFQAVADGKDTADFLGFSEQARKYGIEIE
jgi:regulator of RNase E activity RraA